MQRLRVFAISAIWVLVCVLSVSADFCPTPPSSPGEVAFPLSTAFDPQPQSQVEWTSVVGSLCEVDLQLHFPGRRLCDEPVGFQITTYILNTNTNSTLNATQAPTNATTTPQPTNITTTPLPTNLTTTTPEPINATSTTTPTPLTTTLPSNESSTSQPTNQTTTLQPTNSTISTTPAPSYNTTNVTQPSGSNGEVRSYTIFSLTYRGEHYTATVAGVPPIYPHANQPFDLQFQTESANFTASYTLLLGAAGSQGSIYNVIAITPNITISLLLRSLSPIMVHGQGGYIAGMPPLPPPQCNSFYYVSMPHLQTMGSLRLNGDEKLVSGLSWWDHEFGGSRQVSSGGGGYMWCGLHVGSLSIVVSVQRTADHFNVSESYVELQASNGHMIRGRVTLVQIVSNWTSPRTHNIYPVNLRIHTTLLQASILQVTPIFLDQEVNDMLPSGQINPIWSGDIQVTVVEGTVSNCYGRRNCIPQPQGTGQLELVGFTSSG